LAPGCRTLVTGGKDWRLGGFRDLESGSREGGGLIFFGWRIINVGKKMGKTRTCGFIEK